MQQRYAPRMRGEIRDAEWRIMRVAYSLDGGCVLTCNGLSQLVQGLEVLFLNCIDEVRILDPRETSLLDNTQKTEEAPYLQVAAVFAGQPANNQHGG